MFTNRLFNLFFVIALVAALAFTAQTIFSTPNRTHPESAGQVLREYDLGERYGELPQNSTHFSAEQIRREYIMGERYGETPQQYTQEQALREYWLGERYGVTP